MSEYQPATRARYRSSGKVRWGWLPVWGAVTFATSLLMAFCLSEALNRGFYYGFVAPFFASLPVVGVAYLAIGRSHCRNRVVGGLLGFSAGVLLYLGYFHINMLSWFGPQFVHRVDLLPSFIAHRMATDVEIDERGNERNENAVGNWLGFVFEGLAVVVALTCVAGARAGGVYCEQCRRWAMRKRGRTTAEHGVFIVEALQAGTLESLPIIPAGDIGTPPLAQIDLEYCPDWSDGKCSSEPYFSVAFVKQGSFKRSLKQVALSPDELAALAAKVSMLQPFAKSPSGEMLAESPQSHPGDESSVQVSESPGRYLATANVEDLTDPSTSGALFGGNAVLGVTFALLPLLGLAAGIGMVVTGAMLEPWNPAAGWPVAYGVLLLGIGAVVSTAFMAVCCVNLEVFDARHTRRVVQAAIRFRPDSLVRPNDPEALFVEIVPRKNWGKICLQNATDGGLVLVDPGRRQLLFEGVRQRCLIPGDAITSCSLVWMEPDANRFSRQAVVVGARHPADTTTADSSGPVGIGWELCLQPRPTRFADGPKSRRRAAESLCESVQALMPRAEPDWSD